MGLAPIWFVTGDRGTGKTSLCQRLASEARALGWRTAGILSPAVVLNGENVAIQAFDLRSGRLLSLATLAQPGQQSTIRTKRWIFNVGAITWGNRVWQDSVPCDLLVVDELGPLELERGEGWTDAIPAVQSGHFKLALVVIRPQLMDAARALIPTGKVISADVTGAEIQLESLL